MESLEMNGRTVEEAIQRALEQLGVGREEVEVTVVKAGRSGVLGLGAEEAIVRVTPLAPSTGNERDIAEIAQEVLDKLLALMEVADFTISQTESSAEKEGETTAAVTLDITGDDLGILIGRRGQTLACLQDVVRLIVGHQTESRVPITIDVAGYKQRRQQALQTLAYNMAAQVKVRRTPLTLEPMSAYERRIIHLALADHPGVTTQSVGEGEGRRLVILPREQ